MKITQTSHTYNKRRSLKTVYNREIREIKKQESERVAYMTYAMKIQEERDEAKKEGRIENIQSNVRSLMQKKGWGLEETLDILDVSPEDRKLISTQI